MANLPKKGARLLVGEFVLIVTGVTVALAADSAWAARQERARGEQYLAQLSSDVAENRNRLLAAIELEEMQGQAALSAFAAAASGEPITADSARAWLVERRGLHYSDPRLLTGTFTAMVESGDLRLVGDEGLRTAIAAYVPQITSDRAEFDRWVGYYLEEIRPLRSAAARAVPYDPAPATAEAAALSAGIAVDEAMASLDAAILANQVRITYLRRMLDATAAVATALGGS